MARLSESRGTTSGKVKIITRDYQWQGYVNQERLSVARLSESRETTSGKVK